MHKQKHDLIYLPAVLGCGLVVALPVGLVTYLVVLIHPTWTCWSVRLLV